MEEKSSEILFENSTNKLASQNKMQCLKTQSFAFPVQQILPENFEEEYSYHCEVIYNIILA